MLGQKKRSFINYENKAVNNALLSFQSQSLPAQDMSRYYSDVVLIPF